MDQPPPGDEKRRLKPTSGHWGRRKRRLRRVAWVLIGVALAALSIGVAIYYATRPEVRRPGEKLDDITERLSRGLPEDAPEPLFTDVTAEAGLGEFVSFVGQRSSQLPEDMGSGVAWGDFDNDGDDDAFLVSAGGALDTLTRPAGSVAALRESGRRYVSPERGVSRVADLGNGGLLG